MIATSISGERLGDNARASANRLGLNVVLDFGLWARIERDEMRSVARSLGVVLDDPWFVPGSFSYNRDAEFPESLAEAFRTAEDLVPGS